MSVSREHRPPVKDVRWVNSTAIVDAAGEIDLNVSADFQQQLLALLDKRPQRIIINLAGVDYMDSSGVASLVKLLSRIRKAGATLYLVGMTERVRSVFEITRLDSVFDIRAAENEVLSQA